MILLRIIVFPLALIYGLVVRIRNYFYDSGILSSRKFDTPTICIGNLNLGGTGKTPMVEFLISELKDTYKIAVLSRGYKRKSHGFLLAKAESTVEELGDEPFQIHQKFGDITVAVEADRTNGIVILEKNIKPDLIILDDAFQHRKVVPSFSILLTTYDILYCDDYFVPTGTLRDSRNQAKRADFIVVTKCPSNLSEDKRNRIIEKLRPGHYQKVLFSFLEYGDHLKGGTEEVILEKLKGRQIALVTGIANPTPLTNYLGKRGIDFEHLLFKDHHRFTKTEIDNINSKDWVLTTEKDYVRLGGKVKNLSYIQVAHKFFGSGKEELIRALETIMRPSF